MKNQFIPHNLALKLKELGFNEKCLGGYDKTKKWWYHPDSDVILDVPLWQQAFDWFRDEYDLFVKFDFFQSDEFKGVDYDYCIIDLNKPFKEDGITDNPLVDYSVNETYYFKLQEARQACLEKLIELCTK